MSGNLLAAVVGARLISGTANFFMNRRIFEARRGTVARTAVRYRDPGGEPDGRQLHRAQGAHRDRVPLGIAKVVGDGAIYVASYVAQRRLVFTERG